MVFSVVVLTVISQLHWSSIDQLHELWELWVKLWLAIQWNVPSIHKNMYSQRSQRIYFHHSCSNSPVESDCPSSKKQGPVSECCDHSSLMERDLTYLRVHLVLLSVKYKMPSSSKSRSLQSFIGTPSMCVTTASAWPPSGPTFRIPKYASAIQSSPVFLLNRSPKGRPHTCSNARFEAGGSLGAQISDLEEWEKINTHPQTQNGIPVDDPIANVAIFWGDKCHSCHM